MVKAFVFTTSLEIPSCLPNNVWKITQILKKKKMQKRVEKDCGPLHIYVFITVHRYGRIFQQTNMGKGLETQNYQKEMQNDPITSTK